MKRTEAYLAAINTPLPSQLHQSTECCPLKMPATETGEMLGRTTLRTQPESEKPTTTMLKKPRVYGIYCETLRLTIVTSFGS